nr:hypothetical protein CFP56_15021 [Quercus suber]
MHPPDPSDRDNVDRLSSRFCRRMSHILLTHWIVTMLINFIIKDMPKDVMHPLDPLDCDHANRLRYQGSITHPLNPSDCDHADRLHHTSS